MWRSQEERWKSEHAVRKTKVEDLFATIKTQVCIVVILIQSHVELMRIYEFELKGLVTICVNYDIVKYFNKNFL